MVGINAKNKNILHEKFICPICSLILRDPIQLTQCGHRLCQSCFDHLHEDKCPQCLTEIQRSVIKIIDRGFQRDMQSLSIECSLCNWTGTLNKYQDHLNHDHPNPKCQHCDQQFNSVNNLNEHQVSQCQNITINCLLEGFGCEEQILRCNISNHYLSEHHQNSLCKFSQQMQLQIENERKSLLQTSTDLCRSRTVVAVDPDTVLLQYLCETLSILLDDEEILGNGKQQCLNSALLQCQKKFPTLTPDFLRVKISVQETNCLLDKRGHSEDIFHDMQHVSYDGTLIWKITNFQEKLTDAQSERQTSIYSPVFYSSPSGYKMRARLYLHGDGNARRTHMSLFFVLMRSLNDSILKFPFNYKVTFCMYDQTPTQRHIIDSFEACIESSSFQRLRSDMNIVSGIPKFFPLAMIQQEENSYVRDDTMFIRVIVDFGDMPKTLLPYALSLNPGLPTHVQQALIKQEVERRAQQSTQKKEQAKK